MVYDWGPPYIVQLFVEIAILLIATYKAQYKLLIQIFCI